MGNKRRNDIVLKLSKALYGLVQAPKAWMGTLTLMQMGGISS